MLVQQLQHVVDDRVLSLGEQVRLREGGLRNLRTGILAAELSDEVVKVLLRAEALPFEHFHMAAISHMLEIVASSIDMLSRVGRCSLMAYLVYVEGCLRLRDHCLSHANFHRRFAILPGSTGSHFCSSEVIRITLPVPILPDNFVNARVRWRSPAQSYSRCNLADKNEVLVTVWMVL